MRAEYFLPDEKSEHTRTRRKESTNICRALQLQPRESGSPFRFRVPTKYFFLPSSRRKHNSFERKAAGKTIQRVLRCSWFRRSRKTRKNITAAAGQQDSMTQHTLATHNYGTVNIAAQHANHNMSVDIFPMFQRCSNTAHFQQTSFKMMPSRLNEDEKVRFRLKLKLHPHLPGRLNDLTGRFCYRVCLLVWCCFDVW